MRGHRDDSQAIARRFALALANGLGRLEAAHHRHLQVHQHDVELFALDGIDGLLSVLDYRHVMTSPLEQTHGHPLIDDVVFGEQHLARPELRRCGRGLTLFSLLGSRRFGIEDSTDRRMEIERCNRLRQARGNAELAAQARIVITSRRSQHHDGSASQVGTCANLLGQLKAIHARHLRVEQDEVHALALLVRLWSASSASRPPGTTIGVTSQRVS